MNIADRWSLCKFLHRQNSAYILFCFFWKVMKNVKYNSNGVAKRKSKILATVCVFIVVIILITLLFYVFVRVFSGSKNDVPTTNKLYSLWREGNYQDVYDSSTIILEHNPMNVTANIFHGYSSFFLAISQTDISISQNLLDEAINNLRISQYYADEDSLPQIYYMLGKAYFQKNTISSYHYYSDLAVKFLEMSRNLGYVSMDIPEYLGLCYADLEMTDKSLASFTEALLKRESDVLLLAIAQQYYKNFQNDIAKQYLFRVNY